MWLLLMLLLLLMLVQVLFARWRACVVALEAAVAWQEIKN